MYLYITLTLLTLMPITAAAMFAESRRTTTPPHQTPNTTTYKTLQTIEVALIAAFFITIIAASIHYR